MGAKNCGQPEQIKENRGFGKMAGTPDKPPTEEMEQAVALMTTTITSLLSRLGSSYSKNAEEDSATGVREDNTSQNDPWFQEGECSRPSVDFPSLSLDRDELQNDTNNDSRSKDEVQMQAASLLARKMSVCDAHELHQIPRIMLENLFASFDTLVDARILVYSKILRSHARSLAECNDPRNDANAGLMAVEYKLKTLLEIGTNLSADSFVTKFSIRDTDVDYTKAESASDGKTVITIPIVMEAHIADLCVPSPFDDRPDASMPLSWRADGSITGTFTQNLCYSHVTVDVDADALLSSMITQATLVVGSVVDVTNEAWARTAIDEPVAHGKRPVESTLILPEPSHVSPELGPLFVPAINKSIGHLNLIEASCIDLISAERCAKRASSSVSDGDEASIGSITDVSHLVDYAIGELDDAFIARAPPAKKQCLGTH